MKADISILGLFKLKAEGMKFWQLLTLIIIGVVAVIAAISVLKIYVLPVLGTQGLISVLQFFKSRSP